MEPYCRAYHLSRHHYVLITGAAAAKARMPPHTRTTTWNTGRPRRRTGHLTAQCDWNEHYQGST
jgi:hypothetical protein